MIISHSACTPDDVISLFVFDQWACVNQSITLKHGIKPHWLISFTWTSADTQLTLELRVVWQPQRVCAWPRDYTCYTLLTVFSLLRGQDIDRGNVEEACFTLPHRARFGPNNLPAGQWHWALPLCFAQTLLELELESFTQVKTLHLL